MRRVFRRHRNPHKQDEAQKDQPFFPKAHAREQKPFFPGPGPQAPVQTKLAIGQPGDKYENEADAVAARVVNGTDRASVQSQGISSIQRMATPEEDKGL